MVTVMTDVPQDVAAFKLTGKITVSDYQDIIMPKVDEVAKTGKVRFLILLETSIGNFNLGAVWDDIKMGIQHLSKWHRSAIVSDQESVKVLTNTAGQLIPGEVQMFSTSELLKAKEWVAA